jgi:3-hydroxyisobutyrate dehydrogenase-like beta-hydroxyacid dehydrogenase
MRIGFIGVGLMGQGMVINLMKAGHQLKVMAHRNRAPIEAVVRLGAREAKQIAEVGEGSELVMLCVDSADTVATIVERLKPHVAAGQIIIDTTTSDPRVTTRLEAELKEMQVTLADAPITGGPEQVLAGEAGALVGADAESFPTIAKVLGAFCSRVHHFGPAGAGHRAKLISNYLACGMVGLIADCYRTARQAGVDWGKLYDVQLLGSTHSGALKKMVGPALTGDFDGYRFSIANAAKDMRYYCDLAETLGCLTPMARETHLTFEAAMRHGEKNVSRLIDPEFAERRP